MPVLFPGTTQLQEKSVNLLQSLLSVTSGWSMNINIVPIDYASQPRLRGRLTLRRLALRRKPWTFSGSVSHTSFRYSCQHSHFWYLQHASQHTFAGLQNAPLPIYIAVNSVISVYDFSPVTSSAQIVLFRSVSYYAFFKGWLLLSQPPDCFG